jgi:hypothetical protein
MLELENKQARVVGLAGGGPTACGFRGAGTLLLRRVKRAFARGEAGERIRAAGGLFSSLRQRGFVARSKGRSGEESDFRRRSNACTGLFESGSVSKPPASR